MPNIQWNSIWISQRFWYFFTSPAPQYFMGLCFLLQTSLFCLGFRLPDLCNLRFLLIFKILKWWQKENFALGGTGSNFLATVANKIFTNVWEISMKMSNFFQSECFILKTINFGNQNSKREIYFVVWFWQHNNLCAQQVLIHNIFVSS